MVHGNRAKQLQERERQHFESVCAKAYVNTKRDGKSRIVYKIHPYSGQWWIAQEGCAKEIEILHKHVFKSNQIFVRVMPNGKIIGDYNGQTTN